MAIKHLNLNKINFLLKIALNGPADLEIGMGQSSV